MNIFTTLVFMCVLLFAMQSIHVEASERKLFRHRRGYGSRGTEESRILKPDTWGSSDTETSKKSSTEKSKKSKKSTKSTKSSTENSKKKQEK
mmetsp:Transcript_18460/g.38632  ORF Transcript_18460/g.38632 Transcript_18460/m.38632 type:complete len:92 (+) Transcript_18460:180-455(+)